MKRIIEAIKWRIGNILRPLKTRKLKKNINNKSFSIVSSNCIGGFISHDLGVRFNSPTVNLYIGTQDFVKFIENIHEYLRHDLLFDGEDKKQGYPIGRLNDILIHFVHYKNFDDAKIKWDERKKRINFSNLFIIMTDRDDYNDELLERINLIKYPKILFTSKSPRYDFQIQIKKYSSQSCVGEIHRYSGFSGKRIYEKYFDYVSWLNKNEK